MPDDLETKTVQFLDFLETNLPDELPGEGVVAACDMLIRSYAPDPQSALAWVTTLIAYLAKNYAEETATETDGECMCDTCTAERKANAN